ncbi:hypothetical protein AMATHDRAFT_802 [Amanita thiersii Skay4041]|uniref:Uncharacterized protein n=1 Tax=Amanita thiersii Skay4041 TaxID=703135 RepID=A0A2A9NZJ7_9AGAR|nr:hypothetical protein AMATHDRAFT_802 [Amanita thiersii Skay4041]
MLHYLLLLFVLTTASPIQDYDHDSSPPTPANPSYADPENLTSIDLPDNSSGLSTDVTRAIIVCFILFFLFLLLLLLFRKGRFLAILNWLRSPWSRRRMPLQRENSARSYATSSTRMAPTNIDLSYPSIPKPAACYIK